MNKNITLVILAGGIGSRFGGLKQIEPIGPNEEFIIDYSIYDAIKAGFNKIIFCIKKENYQIFEDTISKRIKKYIKVEYCFQTTNNLDNKYKILKNRKKPLGTAHAILCCQDKLNEPFAIINADDFYGRDAFFKAYKFLTEKVNSKKYGLVGYLAKNTIAINKIEKRAICKIDNKNLNQIIESVVKRNNQKIIAKPLEGRTEFEVNENDIISMNMFLFDPSIFKYLSVEFSNFLDQNKDNQEQCEFLLPVVLHNVINKQLAIVEVLNTNEICFGVTYKEDVNLVKKKINKLINNGEYNNNLWN